jgi:uncharacterized membrane protein
MLKKVFLALLVVATLGGATPAQAQTVGDQFFTRGKVIEVSDDQPGEVSILGEAVQVLLVEVLSGPDEGQAVTITYNFSSSNYAKQHVEAGEIIVLAKVNDARGDNYYVLDNYRLPAVLGVFVLFALAAIVFGRARGAGSLVGLIVSLSILMVFVVPRIIAGDNPIVISFLGAGAIAVTSILLAHGFKRRTYVALACWPWQ